MLLFDKINPSLKHNDDTDINEQREHALKISRLGTRLFDKILPVQSIRNITGDGVKMRLYSNSNDANQPLIVYYHGGGFAMYNMDSHDAVCRRLCIMNKALVLSVDYRLAPEHIFPAAHKDAYRALVWAHQHIQEYNGNPDKIMVAGDSAGGTLAACMAHRVKQEKTMQLLGQILVYPWVDGKINAPSVDRNGTGYFLTKETMLWFQKKYTPDPKDFCNPGVSPLYEKDFTGLPPAFILTAEFDPLLDDGRSYAEKLKSANNNVRYKEYKGLVHGFFNIPKIDREAMGAYYDVKDFISSIV
jgi:acetyl esterase